MVHQKQPRPEPRERRKRVAPGYDPNKRLKAPKVATGIFPAIEVVLPDA